MSDDLSPALREKIKTLAVKAAHADVERGDGENTVGLLVLAVMAKAAGVRMNEKGLAPVEMRRAVWREFSTDEQAWLDDVWPQEWR